MFLLDSELFWVLLIFISIELYRVQYFSVVDDKLIIKRRVKSIIINFNDILKIEEIKSRRTFMFLRVCGFNSGLWNRFGLFGIFWSPKYGVIHFYLKDRNNVLLIYLKNKKKILISPSEDINNTIKSLFLTN